MRSFHATVEAGAESKCFSLGLLQKEVDVMLLLLIYFEIPIPFLCIF